MPPPAAAAQEAPRNSALVATRSWARLRTRSGSTTTTWVSSGITSTSSSSSSTSTGRQRLHALDRDAGGDLGGHLGELRVGLAQRGGAAAYVVGEEQLAARRCPQPLDASRSCAGRRRRRSGSPRPRRPRTPPGSGAARSAGRRRPDRRGPRTRRASRPGRPGCTPRPRAAGSTSSSSAESPRLELDRLEVAEPAHLRLQDRPDRRDDDPQPARCRPSTPGWRSRRSTASRRPTVSLRGLSRSCGSVSQLG